MNILMNNLERIYNNETFIIILIVLFIALLKNIEKIRAFFYNLKRTNVKKIDKALESKYLSKETKYFLERELENEHFKLVTGIYIEKEFRDELLSLHRKSGGDITFLMIQRAFKYLKFSDSKIKVKISIMDKVEYYVNWFMTLSFLLFSSLLFIIPQFLDDKTLFNFIFFYFLGGVLLICSVWFLAQAHRMRVAEKISAFLDKQENHTKAS